MKTFSKSWKSSTKPNKQRKFRFKAPLHIRGNMMHAHLSKELKTKYSKRSLRLRLGDKVRIMRGQFKRQEGKVEEVDLTKYKVYISKIEHTKRDGTKARYPIDPSNIMIVELNESKRRLQKTAKPAKQKPAKAAVVEASTDQKPPAENTAPKKRTRKRKTQSKAEKA